jgi:hypothetical protein
MTPMTTEQAADLAWLYILAGDVRSALGMLSSGTRGHERLSRRVRELLATCVELEPSLWRQALRAALSAGTALDRVRAASGVARARMAAAPDQQVPRFVLARGPGDGFGRAA